MKNLKVDTFLKYNYLSDLEVSPNHKQLSFVKTMANYDANNYNHKLYVSDGKKHQEILDLKDDARYFWQDKDNILYFSHDSEVDKKLFELKHSLLYRYNLKTKTSKLAYQFKIPVSNVLVLNERELLITSDLSADDHKLLETEEVRQAYLNTLNKETYYHIIDEVPFQSNGKGFIDNKRSQAFIYNIKAQTYTALVDKDVNFGQYEIDASKNIIYFTSKAAKGVPHFFDDISKYTIKTKTIKNLYNKDDISVSKLIPLKDKLYILADDKKAYGINQNPDFYSLENNKLKKILSFGKSSNNSIGSDVRFGTYTSDRLIEDKYYFVGTLNDRSCLYEFDGKNLKTHYKPKGSIETFVNFKDKFYLIGLFNNNLQELYIANVNDNDVSVISEFNQAVLSDTYIAKPTLHKFKNADQDLDGWVLLPKDYDQNKQYPAILDIHGGPKTIYSDIFYHEMQAWVNLGYVVFYTNPRGGDAYGDDFADIRGKYGTIDYQDIMAFTDLVEKEYSIDSKRIGVTGGSYGGFMTNWIVSHSNRFSAAATQRSISNWISFYGTADIGSYFAPDQTAGHPLDDHQQVWEQSPLKHANNIKTPLLFIHSDQDYRCPIEQATQLYTVLKINGVETRFVWFNGENHDLSRSGKPQSRLKRLEEITNWMEKHLK